MPISLQQRRRLLVGGAVIVVLGGIAGSLLLLAKSHPKEFAVGSLALFEKVSKLLPFEADTKKEIEVVNALVQELTLRDNKTRSYLILLQNNFELRPGGGFLGQYAIVKVKNAEIISTFVEDANLLDQRITAQVTPPWPLTRYAQIKKWKFRDSNFSPDFPTNAKQAERFYRLAGGRESFDAVIAVNAVVLDEVLAITGPIEIPGHGTFSATDGALKLEEAVEKNYLGDDVPAELKQARKNVMKRLAQEIVNRLNHVDTIPQLAELAQAELRGKNVQLFFDDPRLQSLVESVHWDGAVAHTWQGDTLMVIDANLGALKSDYFVKRALDYTVDFTGTEPIATVKYTYQHTAPYGDWRTSDYHTYTRVYAPLGAKYIEGSRVKTGGVMAGEAQDLSRTIFGYKVDVLIGQTLETAISYILPPTITPENYRLLVQKQSGVGTIPLTVHIKLPGKELVHTTSLLKDLNLTLATIEEKVSP